MHAPKHKARCLACRPLLPYDGSKGDGGGILATIVEVVLTVVKSPDRVNMGPHRPRRCLGGGPPI